MVFSKRRAVKRNPRGAWREMIATEEALHKASEQFYKGKGSGRVLIGKAMQSAIAKRRLNRLLLLDAKFNIESDSAFNERFFHFLRSPKAKKPFSFAIVDFDNLKHLNTKKGYAAADKLLSMFVKEISKVAKKNDGFAARFGGDELKILIPKGVRTLSGDLKAALAVLQNNGVSFSAGVTGSSKIANLPSLKNKVITLNLAANRAVNKSKRAGKATVTIAS